MSTTTLVDLTDAQMLDYNMDGDFSMHNSPAEWLSIEATMNDDNPVSALTDYSEPIEIDMEAGDAGEGEITEYEMADDAGDDFDYDGDAHLQDVEVDGPHPEPEATIDTSHAAGFHFGDATNSPHLGHAETLLPTHHLVEHHGYVAETETRVEAATGNAEAQHVLQVAEAMVLPSFSAEEAPVAAFANEGLVEVPNSTEDAPHEVTSPDVAITASVAHTEQSGELPVPQPTSIAESLVSEETVAEVAPETFVVQEDAPNQHKDTADGAREPEATFENTQATHSGAADGVALPLEPAVDEGDPHEISDGVYIDPPPAVLLTLAAAGSSDLCLFNHPRSSSRSQSPEAGPSSSISADSILLQQRPTLYYEPLTDVFAALRQEESIHNFSDFALFSNELTLEAHDLGLSFSEDNIYTHEVTLHDLNVMHDDARLTGPLRLRLSTSPRFIIRYRVLRDQIAQMSLGAPEDNNETAQPSDEVADGDDNTDLGNTSSEPPAQDVHEHVNGDDELTVNQEDPVQVEAATEEALHALDDAAAQIEEEATSEEAADAAESRAEYGTEVTPEEAAEGLDSDEIHRAVDAEDGGDYTDYAENVEDDDEQFGESLPEELGGNADETTDAAGNQDDAAQNDSLTLDPTTHLEDAASEEPEEDSHLHEEASTVEKVSTVDEENFAEDLTEPAAEAGTVDTGHTDEHDASQEDYLYTEPELYDDENWDELEDDDSIGPLQGGQDDNLSKQSSETLSTLSSKRSRDDDEEEKEGTLSETSSESPHSKRVRTH